LALGRKLYNFGIQEEIVETNPFQAIPRPARENRRDRVLSFDELRRLWQALDAEHPRIAAIFRLQILTAQRPGEVRTMRCENIDLASGWWTIPAKRVKNGRTHRVPLSPQARAILESLPVDPNSIWIFPAARGGGPAVTVQAAVERLREAASFHFTPHDLRRTAASHMTGMGIPRLTVTKILNHAEPGVTAVHDRHSYDLEKRQALLAWAEQLERIVSGATMRAHANEQTETSPLNTTMQDHPHSIHTRSTDHLRAFPRGLMTPRSPTAASREPRQSRRTREGPRSTRNLGPFTLRAVERC